jgi:dTDP-4-dehydrorhamnose reductase
MLGADLRQVLGPHHELMATDAAGDVRLLDVTDPRQVLGVVGECRPDMVIHAAAFTDVDGCELDPDAAFRVNALGTWNVAAACRRFDSAMMYISTDYVFDGEKQSPYTEYDAPNPISRYGASKLVGEMYVRSLCPQHFIVRTAWLFGEHGKSFPRTILHAAQAGMELKVVADQVGSPTFTADLAAAILDLIGSPLYGTYHITNKGSCSWYDFAKRTLAAAGMNSVEVRPIKSDEWPTPTRRPKNSVLRNYALESQGKDSIRSWEAALEDFVSRLSL